MNDLVGPSYPYLAYLKIESLANVGPCGRELLGLREHDEIFLLVLLYTSCCCCCYIVLLLLLLPWAPPGRVPRDGTVINYHELHTKNRFNTCYACVIFKRCKSQTKLGSRFLLSISIFLPCLLCFCGNYCWLCVCVWERCGDMGSDDEGIWNAHVPASTQTRENRIAWHRMASRRHVSWEGKPTITYLGTLRL